MKKSILSTFALLAVLVSCQDDTFEEGGKPVQTGDEIHFGVNHANFEFNGEKTRTIYGDYDDVNNLYPIYWESGDQIKIYCPQAAGTTNSDREIAYKVSPSTNDASKGVLGKVNPGENGLRWGTADEHQFFALYPSDAIKGVIDRTHIKCNIPAAQPPKDVKKIDGVYVAYPDMKYAYMHATSTVRKTESMGQPISLAFTPLVTVLEITVNGPKSGQPAISVSQVRVQSVTDQELSGDFNMNMTDGTCMSMESGTVDTYVTIPLQYEGKPIILNSGEKIVLKAFILPYANADAQVAVTVTMTGKGTRTKTLNASDVVAQKINRTSLPALSAENLNFYYWMSELDEKVYFSQLSIPGTHNSYGIDANAVGTNASDASGMMKAYHTKTIEEQFKAGARAFSFVAGFSTTDCDDCHKFYKRTGLIPWTSSYSNWDDKNYDLYVYTGDFNNPAGTLNNLLIEYENMLNSQITAYSSGNCLEFIVLNISFQQVGSTRDLECQRWIKEIDRIIDSRADANPGLYFTGLTNETTIQDLKQKIIVFINYPVGSYPNKAGEVTGAYDSYSYAGYTYNPSTDATNYIVLKDAYKDDLVTAYTFPTNDRDYTELFVQKPEASGIVDGSLWVWKQHLERLENKEVTVSAWSDNTRIATKTAMAKTLFQNAVKNNSQNTSFSNWYFNNLGGFCVVNTEKSHGSNQGQGGNTVQAAEKINKPIYEYLSDNANNSAPVGVVLMNFLGTETINNAAGISTDVYGVLLPQLIIDNNFRFNLKIKGGTVNPSAQNDGTYTGGGTVFE